MTEKQRLAKFNLIKKQRHKIKNVDGDVIIEKPHKSSLDVSKYFNSQSKQKKSAGNNAIRRQSRSRYAN